MEADPSRAGDEAARAAVEAAGVDRADWGLVFATTPHRPQYASMLRSVQVRLGTGLLAGCSARGVLTGSQEIEDGPAVAVLAVRSDRLVGTTMLAPIGSEGGRTAAAEVGRQVAGRAGLLVLLPDPGAMRQDELLKEISRATPGVDAVGAVSSGDAGQGLTFQFYGRNVATRSLAGLHISGDPRRLVAITQGCQPLGEPCRVTRASENVILELDGRPALEILRSRLPVSLRDSLDRLGAHLFVGIPPDPHQDRLEPGEYLVRHLVAADEGTGALAIAAPVHEGQPVVLALRDGQAARDDLKRMLARVAAAREGVPYRFGFYFNCAARGTSLYGLPGIDTAYISGALGALPIIGFFGNAEIAPLGGAAHLLTYTGVLVLVAEG